MDMAERTIVRLDRIAEPGALEFMVGEGAWPFRGVIVRWQGQVHAYVNVCPHQGHPLNLLPDGFFTVDKSQLLCSSHGAVFEPSTGQCTGGPCAGAQLQKLDCRVEEGHVIVRAPESQSGPES